MSSRKKQSLVPAVPPPVTTALDADAVVSGEVHGDGSGERAPPFDPLIEQEAGPVLVEVKLLKPHNHQGEDHPVGATLQVSLDTEQWLRKRGVI